MVDVRSVCRGVACAVMLAGVAGAQGPVKSAGPMASPVSIVVDPGTIVHTVDPMMYGLMTEEINHSYDGGLYAELVRNPTMRGSWMGLEDWNVVSHGTAMQTLGVDREDGPSAALPHSMKLTVSSASVGNEAGVINRGYWGIAVPPHTKFDGSMYAKADGDVGPVMVKLIADDTGVVLAKTSVPVSGNSWQKYPFTLMSGAAPTGIKNHLEITVARPGTLKLQLVSLFPPTFLGRKEGNRIDLMEKLQAMQPKFIRLPGGNYLEGDRLEDWYNWKRTIGPRVDRPGHQAPWTYWSTDGFGLLEFLEWTEELHNEPILAVYAGYALKGDHIKVGKDLEPFVQSAIDEVEYVTGDESTKWGAERAKDGHPAPFPLHFIEIGNEDQFDKSGSYDARFEQFAKALRAKYPQYKLIATTPVKEPAGAVPDVIDDHYYKSPADMFAIVKQYDNAPRNGPKIFVGEWATRSGDDTPNMGDALGDAAWMTSMERNSDLVLMNAYAPLLVNVSPGGMQWSTDLIGFNAATSYGSPSYYAQVLFAPRAGDGVPKNSATGAGDKFFYSVTMSSADKMLHVKLVNASDVSQPVSVEFAGLGAGAHVAKVNALHGAGFQATNSITEPKKIVPVMSTASFSGSTMKKVLPPYSIVVVDVAVK